MNRLGAFSVWLCLVGLIAVAVVYDLFTVAQWTAMFASALVGIALISVWTCGLVATCKAWWHALAHRWHVDEGGRLFDQIIDWASAARRGELAELIQKRRQARNRFARESLSLLRQHDNPVTLRLAMEQRIRSHEDAALASARVFDVIAANASVAGIVCGSVALFVIASLGEGTRLALTSGGVAFGILVSFGAVLSGTVFKPLAARVRARGVRRGHDQARGMKGVVALLQRSHPQRVRVALYGDRCAIEI
ncbi:MAG: hypothetical protein AAF499_02955 [Pseudomonadota bacterium]